MAKFIFKRPTVRIIVRPETQQVITNAQGVTTVNTPAKVIEVKNGVLVTDDKEVIDRVRNDSKFNTEEIREITAADQRAIEIKKQALKEAEEKIARLKEETKGTEALK